MTDLFEDDEAEVLESEDTLIDLEVDEEGIDAEEANGTLDARRRLEKVLEEKRLRDELDDSVDY